MQIAQQQAAQLSASVKAAAAQSSSIGFSGEKKRIAHRPNPSSPKTSENPASLEVNLGISILESCVFPFEGAGPADVKATASRVLSPSQTLQGVKTQTTAGILSKTSSTATHKRVAHTPTMKVSC